MVMRLGESISAVNLLRHESDIRDATRSTLEKLGSGTRVVNAADGPADSVLITEFETQLASFRRKQEALQSNLATLEGLDAGLGEISTLLIRARELLMADAVDAETLDARQQELDAVLAGIDRITRAMKVGGENVLSPTLRKLVGFLSDPSEIGSEAIMIGRFSRLGIGTHVIETGSLPFIDALRYDGLVGELGRITDEAGDDTNPSYSSDGRNILYLADNTGAESTVSMRDFRDTGAGSDLEGASSPGLEVNPHFLGPGTTKVAFENGGQIYQLSGGARSLRGLGVPNSNPDANWVNSDVVFETPEPFGKLNNFFSVPGTTLEGMASNGTNLFAIDTASDRILELTTAGALVRAWDTNIAGFGGALAGITHIAGDRFFLLRDNEPSTLAQDEQLLDVTLDPAGPSIIVNDAYDVGMHVVPGSELLTTTWGTAAVTQDAVVTNKSLVGYQDRIIIRVKSSDPNNPLGPRFTVDLINESPPGGPQTIIAQNIVFASGVPQTAAVPGTSLTLTNAPTKGYSEGTGGPAAFTRSRLAVKVNGVNREITLIGVPANHAAIDAAFAAQAPGIGTTFTGDGAGTRRLTSNSAGINSKVEISSGLMAGSSRASAIGTVFMTNARMNVAVNGGASQEVIFQGTSSQATVLAAMGPQLAGATGSFTGGILTITSNTSGSTTSVVVTPGAVSSGFSRGTVAGGAATPGARIDVSVNGGAAQQIIFSGADADAIRTSINSQLVGATIAEAVGVYTITSATTGSASQVVVTGQAGGGTSRGNGVGATGTANANLKVQVDGGAVQDFDFSGASAAAIMASINAALGGSATITQAGGVYTITSATTGVASSVVVTPGTIDSGSSVGAAFGAAAVTNAAISIAVDGGPAQNFTFTGADVASILASINGQLAGATVTEAGGVYTVTSNATGSTSQVVVSGAAAAGTSTGNGAGAASTANANIRVQVDGGAVQDFDFSGASAGAIMASINAALGGSATITQAGGIYTITSATTGVASSVVVTPGTVDAGSSIGAAAGVGAVTNAAISIAVDGGPAQNFTFTGADVMSILASINGQLTGATISEAGGVYTVTSNATGSTSQVVVSGAAAAGTSAGNGAGAASTANANIRVQVDGGPVQDFDFTGASAADLVTSINAQLAGATISEAGGVYTITSATTGSSSSVVVTAGATDAGTSISAGAASTNVANGNIRIQVDGGAVQDFDFSGATAADIVTSINGQLVGATISELGGVYTITSNSTGSSSSVVVTAGAEDGGTSVSDTGAGTSVTAGVDDQFRISVDGSGPVEVTLGNVTGGATVAAVMEANIQALGGVFAGVTVTYDGDRYLVSSGSTGGTSSVVITAGTNDATGTLKLGVAEGGTETQGHSDGAADLRLGAAEGGAESIGHDDGAALLKLGGAEGGTETDGADDGAVLLNLGGAQGGTESLGRDDGAARLKLGAAQGGTETDGADDGAALLELGLASGGTESRGHDNGAALLKLGFAQGGTEALGYEDGAALLELGLAHAGNEQRGFDDAAAKLKIGLAQGGTERVGFDDAAALLGLGPPAGTEVFGKDLIVGDTYRYDLDGEGIDPQGIAYHPTLNGGVLLIGDAGFSAAGQNRLDMYDPATGAHVGTLTLNFPTLNVRSVAVNPLTGNIFVADAGKFVYEFDTAGNFLNLIEAEGTGKNIRGSTFHPTLAGAPGTYDFWEANATTQRVYDLDAAQTGTGVNIFAQNFTTQVFTQISDEPGSVLVDPLNERTPRYSYDAARVVYAIEDPATGKFDVGVRTSAGALLSTLDIDAPTNPNARLNADGTKVVYNQGANLVVSNIDGSNPIVFANAQNGVFSPVADMIIYEQGGDLFLQNADGSGSPVQVNTQAANATQAAFNPAGTEVAFSAAGPGGDRDIFVSRATDGLPLAPPHPDGFYLSDPEIILGGNTILKETFRFTLIQDNDGETPDVFQVDGSVTGRHADLLTGVAYTSNAGDLIPYGAGLTLSVRNDGQFALGDYFEIDTDIAPTGKLDDGPIKVLRAERTFFLENARGEGVAVKFGIFVPPERHLALLEVTPNNQIEGDTPSVWDNVPFLIEPPSAAALGLSGLSVRAAKTASVSTPTVTTTGTLTAGEVSYDVASVRPVADTFTLKFVDSTKYTIEGETAGVLSLGELFEPGREVNFFGFSFTMDGDAQAGDRVSFTFGGLGTTEKTDRAHGYINEDRARLAAYLQNMESKVRETQDQVAAYENNLHTVADLDYAEALMDKVRLDVATKLNDFSLRRLNFNRARFASLLLSVVA